MTTGKKKKAFAVVSNVNCIELVLIFFVTGCRVKKTGKTKTNFFFIIMYQ